MTRDGADGPFGCQCDRGSGSGFPPSSRNPYSIPCARSNGARNHPSPDGSITVWRSDVSNSTWDAFGAHTSARNGNRYRPTAFSSCFFVIFDRPSMPLRFASA